MSMSVSPGMPQIPGGLIIVLYHSWDDFLDTLQSQHRENLRRLRGHSFHKQNWDISTQRATINDFVCLCLTF